MTAVSKFASSNAVVSTGWTNPTNAYADDTSYATAAPGRNGTISSDYGFADFTTGDIPDGSTIDSVTIAARAWLSATVTGGIFGIQGYDNGATSGSEATTTSLTEVTVTATLSGITLSDLRSASTLIKGRCRASKGATNTAMTASLDWVQITVNYTAGATQKTGTDSGTGTDAVASMAAAISGTDTGTGSEASALAAAFASTDSGAGTDTASVAQAKVASDSGVGTDSIPTSGGGTTTVAQDDFSTDYANLNGNPADIGGNYSGPYSGPSAVLAAATGIYTATTGSVGNLYYRAAGTTTLGDGDLYVSVLDAVDNGGGGVWARGIDANNFYWVQFNADMSGTAILYRKTGGANTIIGSFTEPTSPEKDLRLQISGSSPTTLRLAVVEAGIGWGAGWDIDTTDNTAGNQTAAGAFGIWAQKSSAVSFFGDNFLVTTGSGSSVRTSPTVAHTVTDSGTSTEALTDRALTISDSGTATDTATVQQSAVDKTASDSATGTDALGSLSVAPGATAESGAATDTVAALAASLVVTEAGAGSDVRVSHFINHQSTDTGTATDTSVNVDHPTSDAAVGSDAAAVAVVLTTRTDAGTGTDTATLAAALAGADAGAGTDTSTAPAVALTATDSGTATDYGTLGSPISGFDSGTGTDTSSAPVVALTTSDSGVGSDTSSLLAVPPTVTDSATGTDVATVSQGANPVAGADSGVAQDTASLVVQINVSDSGTATDTAVLAVALALTEAGVASDVAAVAAALVATDGGIGADLAVVSLTVTATDSGVATDARQSLSVALSALDAATGTDAVSGRALGVTEAGVGAEIAALAAQLVALDAAAGTDTALVSKDTLRPRPRGTIVGAAPYGSATPVPVAGLIAATSPSGAATPSPATGGSTITSEAPTGSAEDFDV